MSQPNRTSPIEYALIAALIAVVVIGALQALSGNLKTKFRTVTSPTETSSTQ